MTSKLTCQNLERSGEEAAAIQSVPPLERMGERADDQRKKVCRKCKTEKQLSNFFKSNSGKYGVIAICKICFSERAKAYYRANPQKARLQSLKWAKENREKRRAIGLAWYYRNRKLKRIPKKYTADEEKYRLRFKARSAVNNRINDGKFPPIRECLCSKCGKPAQDYHHFKGYDPENWLAVIPLCKVCHRAEHPRPTDKKINASTAQGT